MWKQMRAILYWIWLLIGSQWRSQRKGVLWADLGTLEMRWAEQLITLWILSRRTWERARRELQNQAWREQEQKQEFWWLQKKHTVRLNWSARSPGMQVDRVCSPVPSKQAGCQKWHQGYELHWKNGMPLWPTHSEEGRSIPGAEPIRRSSVLSSFTWNLFWTTQTFTSEMQDSMVRARVNASEGESDLYSSVPSANMWWETEWWLMASERRMEEP